MVKSPTCFSDKSKTSFSAFLLLWVEVREIKKFASVRVLFSIEKLN